MPECVFDLAVDLRLPQVVSMGELVNQHQVQMAQISEQEQCDEGSRQDKRAGRPVHTGQKSTRDHQSCSLISLDVPQAHNNRGLEPTVRYHHLCSGIRRILQ